jgi:multidrug efflux pump subunit AcrA (membrane-fusion protein)
MAPRLRDDLVAATVDEDGVAYVDLTDPATGINFRFYDFEYALAKQLTGQPLAAVVAWASDTYQLDLTSEALDQFIEKLAGLGFLAGAGAGAQPVTLSPASPSSSSGPFGKLPESVLHAGDDPEPVELASSPMFADAVTSGPSEILNELSASALIETPPAAEPPPPPPPPPPPQPAATPATVTEGDATEYRLKEAKSGLWAKGRTLHGINLAPLTPMTPMTPMSPPPPHEGGTPAPLLPRLQMLAPPLPPFSADAPSSKSESPSSSLEPTAARAGDETPLASIAHAIVAEASAPVRISTPTGALEAPAAIGGTVEAGDETSRGSAKWANALTDEVEKPSVERRQPPAPEVVVMPPVAEPAAMGALPRRKGPFLVGMLMAGAVAAAVALAMRPEPHPKQPAAAPALAVHVIAPQPTTYYQWFAPSGVVVAGRDDALGFQTMGKVQDVMPPGTTFSAGEPVARLQGVAARELNVNRVRSRVAFFEQLRDSSRAAGNEAGARQAEANLAARSRELADAQAKLAEMEIRPPAAGQIGQVLVERGALVKPGAPVFRIRAAGPRATFSLTADEQATARALGFCRLETVPGTGSSDGGPVEKSARAIDCTFAAAAPGGEATLTVDLIGATDIAPGTAVHLASARFDGVFPIPRAAVVHDSAPAGADATASDAAAHKSGDRVWIVAPTGDTAQSRAVELAATVDALALVAHGLAVGDSVIVDPPATLTDGAALTISR